jgi:hypothetical protein
VTNIYIGGDVSGNVIAGDENEISKETMPNGNF